jgi:hypothetical protein
VSREVTLENKTEKEEKTTETEEIRLLLREAFPESSQVGDVSRPTYHFLVSNQVIQRQNPNVHIK